jgi:hypothetical protein
MPGATPGTGSAARARLRVGAARKEGFPLAQSEVPAGDEAGPSLPRADRGRSMEAMPARVQLDHLAAVLGERRSLASVVGRRREVCADLLQTRHGPEVARPPDVRGQQLLTPGVERKGLDHTSERCPHASVLLPRGRIPEADHAAVAGRGQLRVVRRKGHGDGPECIDGNPPEGSGLGPIGAPCQVPVDA